MLYCCFILLGSDHATAITLHYWSDGIIVIITISLDVFFCLWEDTIHYYESSFRPAVDLSSSRSSYKGMFNSVTRRDPIVTI